jgi:hypothetical protein
MHVCDVYVTCICSVTVGGWRSGYSVCVWQVCMAGVCVAGVVCMCWCGGRKKPHSKAILFWAHTQCATFPVFYWFSCILLTTLTYILGGLVSAFLEVKRQWRLVSDPGSQSPRCSGSPAASQGEGTTHTARKTIKYDRRLFLSLKETQVKFSVPQA